MNNKYVRYVAVAVLSAASALGSVLNAGETAREGQGVSSEGGNGLSDATRKAIEAARQREAAKAVPQEPAVPAPAPATTVAPSAPVYPRLKGTDNDKPKKPSKRKIKPCDCMAEEGL